MASAESPTVRSLKIKPSVMSCEEEVGIAEDLLVLSMFKEASDASKTILDRLTYAAREPHSVTRKRAAFVWMQAEFAIGSLAQSWQYLEQAFQDDVSTDVATVW